jgi:hypothetical protein
MRTADLIACMSLNAALVLSMCACIEKWDAVDPNSRKPIAGNPCGNLGVPCFDMNGLQNGDCCSEGTTCGGGKWSVGCPADSCCDIREIPEELKYSDSGAVHLSASPVFVIKGKKWHP